MAQPLHVPFTMNLQTFLLLPLLTVLVACLPAPPVYAHCDTTKGPVVTAARAALEAGNPNLVLHWVGPADEDAVTAAFQQTMEVRALGPRAKALADRYFFETLVRIHRAGEGAPYTGLSDADPEPIIAATDSALESRSPEHLERELVSAVRSGLAGRFAATAAARDFPPGDVNRGRASVTAYVSLTHWVEAVFTAAEAGQDPHHAAVGHVPSPHGGGLAERGHPGTGSMTEPRPSRSPWLLTVMLAIAVLIQATFLVRRRRHASA